MDHESVRRRKPRSAEPGIKPGRIASPTQSTHSPPARENSQHQLLPQPPTTTMESEDLFEVQDMYGHMSPGSLKENVEESKDVNSHETQLSESQMFARTSMKRKQAKRMASTKKRPTQQHQELMGPPASVNRPADVSSGNEDEEDDAQVDTLQTFKKVEHRHEEEAVEFFRTHPAFYAKKGPKYMDSAYKARLLHDQGVKMGIEPINLSKWFHNMRTRWVKLNKKKSGVGATQGDFTPREQWILDSFSFLRKHVIPSKPRQSNVGRLPEHQDLHPSLSPNKEDGSQAEALVVLDNLPSTAASSTTAAATSTGHTGKATSVAGGAGLALPKLLSYIRESMAMTRQIAQKITPAVPPQTKDQRLKSLLDTIEHGMANCTEGEFLALQKMVWDKLHEFQMARHMALRTLNSPPTNRDEGR